jgi:predicted PurR-regulated permease PerM
MLVVVLVYQQIENNLLSPTIYGKAVNISPFFVILGVTIFGALLGVLGALIAVPVTASLQIVAQEVTKARRAWIAEARAEAARAEAAPDAGAA